MIHIYFTNIVYVCVYSQDGHQVLRYDSSIKKLLLLVNVTNFPSLGRLAEDAHNTELNVSISSSLRYSAVRSEVKI